MESTESMHGIDQLWSIAPMTYVILVAVVSIEVLGIVQALKRRIRIPTALLAFIFCLICGVMQSSLTPQRMTSIFNIVMCSFSVVTLASQAMIGAIKSLPGLVIKAAGEKFGAE